MLSASRLRVALLLVLPLGSADSAGAGNGLGAEIGAVALLGGGVDDVLVEFTGWGGGGVGGCVVEFGGLVLFRGLGGDGDGVAVGLDADGLSVGVTDVFAGVLVGEVEGVAGEGLHSLALHEEGVVVAWLSLSASVSLLIPVSSFQVAIL